MPWTLSIGEKDSIHSIIDCAVCGFHFVGVHVVFFKKYIFLYYQVQHVALYKGEGSSDLEIEMDITAVHYWSKLSVVTPNHL